jgi:hypothetical protein
MSSMHVGPFVGTIHAEWNNRIERVTAGIGSDASMHLHPPEAYQLAAELIAAADAATGQERRYDVARLVTENTLIGAKIDPVEVDRFASAASLVKQIGGDNV